MLRNITYIEYNNILNIEKYIYSTTNITFVDHFEIERISVVQFVDVFHGYDKAKLEYGETPQY